MKNQIIISLKYLNSQAYYVKILLSRLLIVILLFTLCRILFYLFNIKWFYDSTSLEILSTFIYGLRFDISAIIYFNIVFILLHLVPYPYKEKSFTQRLKKLIFYIFNGIAILLSIIDIEYFKYSKKRATFDIFGMSSDFANLLPQYIKDFWYLGIIFVLFLVLGDILYRKTERPQPLIKMNFTIQSIYLVILLGIFTIGARGGLQLKPIKILDAALYANAQTAPMVLNTPFTILQTIGRKKTTEIFYMSQDEAERLFPIRYRSYSTDSFLNKNVIIIIIESLSQEFMKSYGADVSYTPFLDSLCQNALVCRNSFANGTRSMEAIPAVLASIPHLMHDSYIFSSFQGNRINSIGSILKTKGYQTAFFHGGTNGTMGFDSFIKMAGINKYYGRTEYNNDEDFDGLWGIYDEEFLQYTAQILNATKQPFFAAILTLSSHHPYDIPNKYKDKFCGGKLEIHRSIQYSDYSLQKFFETISKMQWYKNTLFVITGDHTPAESESLFYKTPIGIFAVPIIFFVPHGELKGIYELITQHIDIMPSVLNYLNYNGEYISFGKSIFDTTRTNYVINFINDIYQIFDDEFILQFNGKNSLALFRYQSDPLLTNNILNFQIDINNKLENQLKAIIQMYNYAMINNKLTI